MMTHEEVSAFLQRYAVDPWTTGDTDSLDPLVAEGYVLHPGLTLEDLKDAIRTTRRAVPDLTVRVEESISADDKIAYRWIMNGTHQPAGADASLSSTPVTFTGITILRLQGNKVVEDRFESSSPPLEEQLGADA